MQAALKLLLLSSLLLFSAYSAACDNNQIKTGGLNKTNWKLSAYKCPKGCSSALKNLLDNQLGQPIDFKGTAAWTSGTADACQKLIDLNTTEIDLHALLKEINSGRPPLQNISPEELDVKTNKPLTVNVLCSGPEGQKISHRFIQNGSGQLIAIDEETSILIYE